MTRRIGWFTHMPVYVTRKTADGSSTSLSVPAAMLAAIVTLGWINALLWLVIGIITAVGLLT